MSYFIIIYDRLRSRGRGRGLGRARIMPVVPVIEWNDLRKIEKFTGYFVRTYFEGSCFPVSFWIHFLTDGPRTYNSIEGYNHRLKLFVGAANPNIYKVLTIWRKMKKQVPINHFAKLVKIHHRNHHQERITL